MEEEFVFPVKGHLKFLSLLALLKKKKNQLKRKMNSYRWNTRWSVDLIEEDTKWIEREDNIISRQAQIKGDVYTNLSEEEQVMEAKGSIRGEEHNAEVKRRRMGHLLCMRLKKNIHHNWIRWRANRSRESWKRAMISALFRYTEILAICLCLLQ